MKKTDVIIIGAGPVGLFAVHQLGIKGLKAVLIDNLDKAGGQCIELYADKPMYDFPAVPECTGEQLTARLLEQIEPFKTEIFLNERVEEVRQEKENWVVKTNNKKQFIAPNIMIAGGVGSFEPRKISLKQAEKLEVAKHHSLADLPCWRLNSNLVSVVPSVVGVFTKSAVSAIASRTSFLFHLCFQAESGEWKGH